jgi:hypothetical protein
MRGNETPRGEERRSFDGFVSVLSVEARPLNSR